MAESINGFDVDRVLRGYIETALWSTNDESTPSGGYPLDKNYDETDLDDGARNTLRLDVIAFLNVVPADDLSAYAARRVVREDGWGVDEALGYDLWLNRNGHGVGFWCRDELEEGGLGARLDELSSSQGERHIYVGDDGVLYVA